MKELYAYYYKCYKQWKYEAMVVVNYIKFTYNLENILKRH